MQPSYSNPWHCLGGGLALPSPATTRVATRKLQVGGPAEVKLGILPPGAGRNSALAATQSALKPGAHAMIVSGDPIRGGAAAKMA